MENAHVVGVRKGNVRTSESKSEIERSFCVGYGPPRQNVNPC